MAQKKHFEFRADDTTESLNKFLLAMIRSGRYSGFDTFAGSGDTLVISHTNTGITYAEPFREDPTEWSAPTGVWQSVDGQTITETEPITIAGWLPNTSGSTRIDLVYGNHTYLANVQDGIPAEYFFLIGTSGTGVPNVGNPFRHIPLIQITVPAGVTDLSDPSIIFKAIETPEFAGQDMRARFNQLEQRFINVQSNFNTLQRSFTHLQNNFNTLQGNFDALDGEFSTLAQLWIDYQNTFNSTWVTTSANFQNQIDTAISGIDTKVADKIANYIPIFERDNDPASSTYAHLLWKYKGEADVPANWRDLGLIAFFKNSSIFDLEVAYTNLVNSVTQELFMPVKTFITIPLRNIISDDAGAWLQYRHYKVPISGQVDFVLENFRIDREGGAGTGAGSGWRATSLTISLILEHEDGTTTTLASHSIKHNFGSSKPASFTIPTLETVNTSVQAGDIVYIQIKTEDIIEFGGGSGGVIFWINYVLTSGSMYIQPI